MINNAANRTLNQTVSNLPNVGSAIIKWFVSMSFDVVTKTSVNYQIKETIVKTPFQGVWMPLTAREISYKPDGQRDWKWFRCYSDPSLILNNDDVVTKDGVQYRVSGLWPYDEYGYREYQLVEDYTGKGPDEVVE